MSSSVLPCAVGREAMAPGFVLFTHTFRQSRSSTLSLASEPNLPACGSSQMFAGPSDPPMETNDQISPVDLSVLAG
jgi:hypothetical protein